MGSCNGFQKSIWFDGYSDGSFAGLFANPQAIDPDDFRCGHECRKIVRLPNAAPDAGPTKEAAIRVGKIGQKLLVANPSIGIKPAFHTIGTSQSEVFHKGVDQIMITDGLVKECNDDQLAAVLAVELVKMLGEQENSAPTGKIIDRTPGMDFPIGNDRSLVFGPADGTRIAERYELDRMRMKNKATGAGTVDPKILARGYLSKAGYPSKAVDSISGLLKRQMRILSWRSK